MMKKAFHYFSISENEVALSDAIFSCFLRNWFFHFKTARIVESLKTTSFSNQPWKQNEFLKEDNIFPDNITNHQHISLNHTSFPFNNELNYGKSQILKKNILQTIEQCAIQEKEKQQRFGTLSRYW